MTARPPITLAGGTKALAAPLSAPSAVTPISPAFAAFTRLADALADACAAEELRTDDAAWDVAMADPDAAAEAAMAAARAAGDAQIFLASDRPLVFAARFVSCALGVEHGADREHILHFIDSSRTLWGPAPAGTTARRAEALVERAVERLMRLTDLMADEVLGECRNVL